MPADGAYIGRRFTQYGWALAESAYANPFAVGEGAGKHTLEESLQLYYDYVAGERPDLVAGVRALLADGVPLYCWCHRVTGRGERSAAAHLCHGDVLVALANKGSEPV